MRQGGPADVGATFAREWNAALALVVALAALLFAFGHPLLGAIVIALAVTAFFARWHAMRRQNRGFYGQEKMRSRKPSLGF